MEKAQEYKYYSTQRPVDIGTFPNGKENPPIRIENYEGRIWVEHDTRLAWGELAYAQPLTEKDGRATLPFQPAFHDDDRVPYPYGGT